MEYIGNIRIEYINTLDQKQPFIITESQSIDSIIEMSAFIDVETESFFNKKD